MNAEKLRHLQIAPDQKQRPRRAIWTIFLIVLLVVGLAGLLAWPRTDVRRLKAADQATTTKAALASTASATTNAPAPASDVVLTVSGYIINRERIEISPRFLGVVKWIGVKKGDTVTNGQVVVLLDDTEYQARLQEAAGRRDEAKAAVAKAELDLQRMNQLARTDVESKKALDDARLQLQSAQAALQQAEGAYRLVKTYLDWTVIRSPINGVVLEKLVNPDELVMPQSFGGPRGPSTALLSVADPKDLQVEIDVNEADLSKIALNQKCRVSPEAYPERLYQGYVAEIAPEANRSKGTLQIKVQILQPDRFLTPELSAKVDFLKAPAPTTPVPLQDKALSREG